MRFAIALLLHIPLVLLGWIGWLMVDWDGSEDQSIILAAIGAIAIGAASWLVARKAWLVVGPATVALLLLAFTIVDISPVQPAARSVRKIQVGMSESQVRKILNAEFPTRLRPVRVAAPLRDNTLSFILGPGSRYNGAIVQVCFAHDRVVSAQFLPD